MKVLSEPAKIVLDIFERLEVKLTACNLTYDFYE